MKPPCGKCPDKGCGRQGQCEKYLAFSEEREAIRQKKKIDYMIDGYTVGEVAKAKRSRRKKR